MATTATRVFVCHSSADKSFVRLLARDLDECGIKVWLDEREMGVGSSLSGSIQDALRSSSFVLVVLSKTSIRSKWVERELHSAYALELKRKGVFILPAVLDLSDDDVPIFIQDRIYADFRLSYLVGLASLITTISPSKTRKAEILRYDTRTEEQPFASWTIYSAREPLRSSVALVRPDGMSSPAMLLRSTKTSVVGINKSMPLLRGRVEYRYKVLQTEKPGKHIYFAMIPMQENGLKRAGLIEVGGDVEDAPQNATSRHRIRHVVPHENQVSSSWHVGSMDFDFRQTPTAFYSIFAPRINEGSEVPQEAALIVSEVRIFE